MAKSRFNEHDKITFIGWMDKVLDQSITKQNNKAGFKGIGIWLLNTQKITRTKVKGKV